MICNDDAVLSCCRKLKCCGIQLTVSLKELSLPIIRLKACLHLLELN